MFDVSPIMRWYLHAFSPFQQHRSVVSNPLIVVSRANQIQATGNQALGRAEPHGDATHTSLAHVWPTVLPVVDQVFWTGRQIIRRFYILIETRPKCIIFQSQDTHSYPPTAVTQCPRVRRVRFRPKVNTLSIRCFILLQARLRHLML